jgi:hypothetical protein
MDVDIWWNFLLRLEMGVNGVGHGETTVLQLVQTS